jgi:hypothetical protein
MAKAIELSVPIRIGVPRVNLEAFREFSAGFAREIELSGLGFDRLAAAQYLMADLWLTPVEMAEVGDLCRPP